MVTTTNSAVIGAKLVIERCDVMSLIKSQRDKLLTANAIQEMEIRVLKEQLKYVAEYANKNGARVPRRCPSDNNWFIAKEIKE